MVQAVKPLLALTVWQPWSSAIVLGHKGVENRTWAPPGSLVGSWIAIHAGQRVDDAEAFAFCRARGFEPPADLPRSAIVGVARLAGVVESSSDPWFVGPIGWCFDIAVAIEPVPCRGARKLWTVPGAITDQVRERLRAARGR